MTNTITALLSRRSVTAKDLHEPGPSKAQLQYILQAAHRVPDHGKIGPWRFVIFEGAARAAFGKKLADIFSANTPEASDKLLDFERERFNRAPVVIGVISSPIEHKVSQWEQVLSSGAACQNILVASQALGFGAQWLTEWYSYDPHVEAILNMRDKEKIAGFVYIGSYTGAPSERPRPSLEERITFWPQG